MSLFKALKVAALLAAVIAGTPAWGADGFAVAGGGEATRTDVDPVTSGTRLVTFRYSPNVAFAIRSMNGLYTNIEVPEGETVLGFYLSDPEQWEYHVMGDKRGVLVKPLVEGQSNTATLKTDKRSYELTFESVRPGTLWHQRVRWSVPGAGANGDGIYWQPSGAAPAVAADELSGLKPDKLRFTYRVKGRAEFAPTVVFDDGIRTWMRFDGNQDLPAIFALHEDEIEVVDFSVQGPYVVIPHIAEKFKLQLRNDVVTVLRKGR